jgi:hypothetical protein
MGDLSNFPGINLIIGPCPSPAPAEGCFSVIGWIQAIACWFGGMAIIAIVVALVVYGIQFIISQGNPSKVTNAKNALLWGLVGGIVILGTYTLIKSIAALLGVVIPNFPFNCTIYLQ